MANHSLGACFNMKAPSIITFSQNSISKKLKLQKQITKMVWTHLLVIIITSLFMIPHGGADAKMIDIGVLVDVNSTTGKEERVAMMIGAEIFNNYSKSFNLSLHFKSTSLGPLQSAYAAEELIKEKKVKAIIGMDRWEDAAIVADIAGQAQVPVISFSAPGIVLPSAQTRWPLLVKMARDESEQMKCIAAILRSYNWRRVVAVYEDDIYGGDSGKLAILADAIKESGADIEHRLVLPPLSSLSDPKRAVQEELKKLRNVNSRVFIVLQTSLPLVVHLFREAKNAKLMETDNVWILSDKVAGFLDRVNTSVIYSMEGALGIRNYYPEDTTPYYEFDTMFKRLFRSEYPEEDNFDEPGSYALRAYDSILTITHALVRSPRSIEEPKGFLNQILSSNFTGLSGVIQFQDGQLNSGQSVLRVVNVIGKRYKEIDFWLPGFEISKHNSSSDPMRLASHVTWPGEPKRDPKGWVMPTADKKLIIGVPGRTSFNKYVKVVNASQNKYEGFCIELFDKVRGELNYHLDYKFEPYNGTYDDLVNHVYNKTYDAIIGDMTILSSRSDKVEFTQPYMESGLSLIVPAKSEESAWMFTKPFTGSMWLATGGILVYTMFTVWFLERQTNPEFKGSWKNEISTAVMFTFSSLFFAHREKVYNNLTRAVLAVWLFVVLILNSSYTASLSSMLTIRRLEPNITDVDWLLKNNIKVGCDGDSFVRTYLEKVLKFKPENIKNVSTQYGYPDAFRNGSISAAFLEIPYEKVYINQYCKQYSAIMSDHTFGGLGFVFQKGSPIAADVSRAILTLLETGEMKSLEDKWFPPSGCSSNSTDDTPGSLSFHSFWGLYAISATTSTTCLLLFLVFSARKYLEYQAKCGNATPSAVDDSVWDKTTKFARFVYHGEEVNTTSAPSPESEWTSVVPESARHSASSWVELTTSSSPETEAAGNPDQSRTRQQ